MIRCHGPFPGEAGAARTKRRKRVRDQVKTASCSCGICSARIQAGEDPHGWPETPCWVRANPPGEELPVMERPVYLCDRVGVGLEVGS